MRKFTFGWGLTLFLFFFSIATLAKDFEKVPLEGTVSPWPTLILLQDIWGVDNFMKREAERYSELGFYVYVVDFYSGIIPVDVASAGRMKDKLVTDELLSKVGKIVDRLVKKKNVDKLRLGILGWGLGGSIALRAAASNPQLRTMVMSYGDPVNELPELKKIKAKGLALFAGKDPRVSQHNIDAFKSALNEARVNFDVKTFPDAPYGFFDYTRTENYNPKAAEEGKKLISDFLKKHLSLTDYIK